MQKSLLPIGVFDSGVGGVSVLRNLVSLMPNENYIYLADSKNAPYGTKSREEILEHATSCADYLVKKGIKALVVACNTATSVCIETLRTKYPDVCIVGIEPAIKPALKDDRNSTVAVMATPVTLTEDRFSNLLKKQEGSSKILLLPCPGLMELVENGLYEEEDAYQYLESLFADVIKPDAIVLGCTHYPFLRSVIENIFPSVRIYDGGPGVANQVKKLLKENGLLTKSTDAGSVEFQNTLEDKEKDELAKKLLYK